MESFETLDAWKLVCESAGWIFSPFRYFRTIKVLAFTEPCKMGPTIVPGFMTTTSKPFSFAKSHAARSASVFERAYHPWDSKSRWCQSLQVPAVIHELTCIILNIHHLKPKKSGFYLEVSAVFLITPPGFIENCFATILASFRFEHGRNGGCNNNSLNTLGFFSSLENR